MKTLLQTREACKDLLASRFHPKFGTEFLIHQQTRELLHDLNKTSFNETYRIWKNILNVTFQVNRRASNGDTPLTMVCQYVTDTHFQTTASKVERTPIDSKIIDIIEHLLGFGADANIKGQTSTPLMILLVQRPFIDEDVKLTVEIVERLLKSGADVHLKPVNDSYGSPLNPLDYAAKNYRAIHSVMTHFLERKCRL